MTDTIDPTPWIQWGGAIFAVLAFAAALVVPRLLRARNVPEKVAEALPEEPRCPCGAVATRTIPRHKVVEVPFIGRIVLRQRDAFGAFVVCDAHADVAATVIDERIAEARLADARAERDRITALANGGDVLGAVAATLPETQRKAYERSLRPMPAVRALKAANGDEGEGG